MENPQIKTLETLAPDPMLPTNPNSLAGPQKKEEDTKPAIMASGVDIEKKIRRAERFGMPVQLSEEEKRRTRAQRFGTATGSPLQGTKDGENLEEQKRKARAERFGLVVHAPANEEAKKKARLERFADKRKPNTMEEEKMKARAARFSQASSASKPNGNVKSETVALSETAEEETRN